MVFSYLMSNIQKVWHFALRDVFIYKNTDTSQKAGQFALHFYIQKCGHFASRDFSWNFWSWHLYTKIMKICVTWCFYIQKYRHFSKSNTICVIFLYAKNNAVCVTFLYAKKMHFAFRFYIQTPQLITAEIYYSACGQIDRHNMCREESLEIKIKVGY